MEAGVDEAGRGSLAGPVVAAAVILPDDITAEMLPGLNDSKQLSAAKREKLRPLIKEVALAWAIGEASAAEIDELNILGATMLAMDRAIRGLGVRPDHLLIDGNRFRTELEIPYTTIVGGDGKMMSIAAASVLAKTHRDEIMRSLDVEYPGYGWAESKGYPTKAHYDAIARLGVTPHHRRSFRLS